MSASGRVVMLLAGSPRRAVVARAAALLAVAWLLAAALVTFVARPAPAGAAACGSKHKDGRRRLQEVPQGDQGRV
jgi:hypothetical protein